MHSSTSTNNTWSRFTIIHSSSVHCIENKNAHTDEYFKDQIILSTLNDVVDNINNVIIQRFPRVFQTF